MTLKIVSKSRVNVYLNPNSLHVINTHFVVLPLVDLGRARTRMVLHLRCAFEHAAVLQVCCDAGCPEGVVADPRANPRRHGAAAHHRVGVGLRQRSCAELAGAASDRAEERPFRSAARPQPST